MTQHVPPEWNNLAHAFVDGVQIEARFQGQEWNPIRHMPTWGPGWEYRIKMPEVVNPAYKIGLALAVGDPRTPEEVKADRTPYPSQEAAIEVLSRRRHPERFVIVSNPVCTFDLKPNIPPELQALAHLWVDGVDLQYQTEPWIEPRGWVDTTYPFWDKYIPGRLRVKPSTAEMTCQMLGDGKPSINWTAVGSKWRYLTRDGYANAFLWTDRPRMSGGPYFDGFLCPIGDKCSAEGFASYDPGTCDWKDSLVRRG